MRTRFTDWAISAFWMHWMANSSPGPSILSERSNDPNGPKPPLLPNPDPREILSLQLQICADASKRKKLGVWRRSEVLESRVGYKIKARSQGGNLPEDHLPKNTSHLSRLVPLQVFYGYLLNHSNADQSLLGYGDNSCHSRSIRPF